MGYLSFQIIVFLLLAALLGVIIGWLLRGTKFQSELNDLDARWRTKLGDVEGERDRFVAELNQSNDAKVKLDAQLLEARKAAETHESSLQQMRRDQQTKVTALADQEKLAATLQSDLKVRGDDLSKAQAQLAEAQRSTGDADRMSKELAAAGERAATLESSLKEAKAANASCKTEVDRLKTQIAELQRSSSGIGGTAAASPGASGGGALGLMGSSGSATSTGGTGGSSGGAGSSGAGIGAAGSSPGSAGRTGISGSGATGSGAGGSGAGGSGAGGSGDSAMTSSGGGAGGSSSGSAGSGLVGSSGTSATGGGSQGLRGVSGGTGSADGGSSTGGAAGQAGAGRTDPAYPQGSAAPSHFAETGGQRLSGGTAAGSGAKPTALAVARGGQADDLKRISGVGPKLEKTLNSLGIFHFSQIAEFTPDNVVWVDQHLRFKGRVERENWIEQAKVLAAGGETEFSKRQ